MISDKRAVKILRVKMGSFARVRSEEKRCAAVEVMDCRGCLLVKEQLDALSNMSMHMSEHKPKYMSMHVRIHMSAPMSISMSIPMS